MSDVLERAPDGYVEPQAVHPHRLNWVKWGLGCFGVSMILISGVVLAGLIILPIAFRSLPPEDQSRLAEKIPVLGTLRPTRVYRATTLPTAQSVDETQIAAILSVALVTTETPTPTVTFTSAPEPTSLLSTITPTPLLGQVVAAAATNTPQPTPTSLPTAIPTNPPTPTEPPLPVNYHLTGIKRVYQKWNDCGPANLTQVLQYYGWSGNEDDARTAIKPNADDRNVSPRELVNFVLNKTGVKSLVRVVGTLHLIKRLVSNNFGVIMETGYNLQDGWAGHYLTVLGYDDNAQIMYGGDTNLGFGADGLGQQEKYDDLDKRWQHFNRLYIVVYPRERELELAAILGPDADPSYNLRHAVEFAQQEVKQDPENPFVWHNLGAALTQIGDYRRAITMFDKSRNTGIQLPWRFLWYQFYVFEAYYKMGYYNEVKDLANVTLANATIEEALYWRGMVEAAMGDKASAVIDFKAVLKFNPNFSAAADALAQVQNGTFQPPVAAKQASP